MLNKLIVGLQTIIKPAKLWQDPFWLGLEITTKCNSECRTCPLPNYSKILPKPLMLTFQQFRHIIEQTNPRILSLTGLGETLLNPDYFKMVKYAASKGCKVYSTTNGILLKKYATEICASGLSEIVISMDGYDPYTYKTIRGVDQFGQIIEGIDVLKEEKKKKKSNLIVGFNVVVQDINYEHISDIVGLALHHGVSLINFLPLDINGDFHHNQEYADSIDKQKLNLNLKNAAKLAAKHNISTNIRFWNRYFNKILKKMYIHSNGGLSNKTCHHPWSGPFITGTGNVLPCCILVPDKFSIGNIFEKPYKEILNSDKAITFRRKLLKGEKIFTECKECIVTSLNEMAIDMLRRNLLN
jgi:radical SAM protein with 4Fe4S-binding SPASM domain